MSNILLYAALKARPFFHKNLQNMQNLKKRLQSENTQHLRFIVMLLSSMVLITSCNKTNIKGNHSQRTKQSTKESLDLTDLLSSTLDEFSEIEDKNSKNEENWKCTGCNYGKNKPNDLVCQGCDKVTKQGYWRCEVCTMAVEDLLQECDTCGTPRPNKNQKLTDNKNTKEVYECKENVNNNTNINTNNKFSLIKNVSNKPCLIVRPVSGWTDYNTGFKGLKSKVYDSITDINLIYEDIQTNPNNSLLSQVKELKQKYKNPNGYPVIYWGHSRGGRTVSMQDHTNKTGLILLQPQLKNTENIYRVTGLFLPQEELNNPFLLMALSSILNPTFPKKTKLNMLTMFKQKLPNKLTPTDILDNLDEMYFKQDVQNKVKKNIKNPKVPVLIIRSKHDELLSENEQSLDLIKGENITHHRITKKTDPKNTKLKGISPKFQNHMEIIIDPKEQEVSVITKFMKQHVNLSQKLNN